MYKNLYAGHIQNKFDQEKIWSDYKNDKLPNDEETKEIMEKRVEYIKKEEGGTASVTVFDVTDSGLYPAELSAMDGRPLVIEYYGKADTNEFAQLFKKEKSVIFTDDVLLGVRLSAAFKKSIVCFFDRGYCRKGVLVEDESLDGLTIRYWKEDGPGYIQQEVKIFMDCTTAILIGSQMADIVIVNGKDTKYTEKLSVYAEKYVQPTELLAIPGNSGCLTNKLIKSYWCLCDCVGDIEKTLIKKKKREGENIKW